MSRLRLVGVEVGGAPPVVSLQLITVNHEPAGATLWMFGIDREGRSVAARVSDFMPSFLIQTPDEIPVDDISAAEEERERTNQSLGEQVCHIESIESTQYTPFVGFTNGRRDHLWKVTCSSIRAYRRVVKHYKQAGVTMYHEDVDFANQFLQSRSLSYQMWVDSASWSWRSSGRATTCTWEGSTVCRSVYAAQDQSPIPRVLQCYLHLQAVSRDGMRDGHPMYKPDADNAYDRVVLVVLSFVGSWSTEPLETVLFTTCPGTPGRSSYSVVCCDDELGMLDAVREAIAAADPDDLVYFPEPVDTLRYVSARYARLTPNLQFDLGRFQGRRPSRVFGEYSPFRVCSTRSLINVVAAIKRNVGISVESYDLRTLSCHASLRKEPESRADCGVFTVEYANARMAAGVTGYRDVVQATLRAVGLVRALAEDSSIRLEFSNISRVSDTALTDTVSRGEQVRVYNKLVRFCVEEGFYVNRDRTSSRPLRFPVKSRPPTFVDPREHALTSRLRDECTAELAGKLRFYSREGKGSVKRTYVQAGADPFAAPGGAGDSSDEDRAEGGNVMRPCPRFWGERRVAVFDFASLYPSIMQAYNISYETIVFEERYMDLPGVAYLLVAVNQDETVAVADIDGVIPKMLRTLIDARNAIKRRMKQTSDPFRKSMYDKEQNSMKVLCNATYGFCGADGKGAMLAVKTVMYIVTSIGRYLQKQTSEHLASVYGVPSIYGDTDSVFVRVDHGPGTSIGEVVQYTRERYGMGEFTWPSVVARFRASAGLDLDAQPHTVQVNAVLYLVYHKLCEEVSALFRTEIVLEMENMCDNVWMGWVKKHYCYRMWDPSHPGRIQKIKITGMPVKKREYAPWVRDVLMAVTQMLLYGRGAEVAGYLEQQLQALLAGEVAIERLCVSRSYKGVSKYKHFRQPHLQVVQKMERRSRTAVAPNSRVFFVVVRGPDKLYLRTETPEYAVQNGLALDYGYYLKQQLYKPVKKLLTYHPEVCDFERLFTTYTRRLCMQDEGVSDVGSRCRKHSKVSFDDAVRSRNSRHANRVSQATSARATRPDPFARFSA